MEGEQSDPGVDGALEQALAGGRVVERSSCTRFWRLPPLTRSAAKGSTEQIIGDYYGACMDESRVNARGMEPIKPWFAKIDAAHDMAALQQVMAELHDILVNVPFACGSQPDPHKPSWVLADHRRERAEPAGPRLLSEA